MTTATSLGSSVDGGTRESLGESKWACNPVLVVHEKRNSAFTIFVLVRGELRVASPATISRCEHVEGKRFFVSKQAGKLK